MLWTQGWRERVWAQLDQPWDLIIIGGGITGAGIFREATLAGLKTLLVEALDFAYGTSSRSSKLVHGGLRYMKNAQLKLTLESVKERERLLRQGKGLISRLGFLYTSLQGDPIPGWLFGLGLVAYDMMARQWTHRAYDVMDMRELCPHLTTPLLTGGYRYFDAQTDDARIVLRLIQETVQLGGMALNYARASELLRDHQGRVCGIALEDVGETPRLAGVEVTANAVINATGAWSDHLREKLGRPPRLRPLRGSHLIFAMERLPLTRAVSLMHPYDGRPVFALPWEGVVIFGTTDIDHHESLAHEPGISEAEVEYLLQGIQHVFPELELSPTDIQATFSGIRPVVDTGKLNPSKESREHVIWQEDGLLTVSGGKLTTFRLMARDALRAIRLQLPTLSRFDRMHPVLSPLPENLDAHLAEHGLRAPARLRLMGRYASYAAELVTSAQSGELETIGNTAYHWAELRWAAQAEGATHLDDILIRRVRLGLLLPNGGLAQLDRIRSIVQPEMGWDDTHWQEEVTQYVTRWQTNYSSPLSRKTAHVPRELAGN
jgi:glycerol-3-phosphate dehydrogenase